MTAGMAVPDLGRRILQRIWAIGVGTLLCLSPLTAVLVAGWLMRLMRQSACREMHRLSGRPIRFEAFASTSLALAGEERWPRWILAQNAGQLLLQARSSEAGFGGRMKLRARALAGSLWENFRLGVAGLANVAVFVLPAGALWLLAWWGGWENSFNKGYEQAVVGPGVSLLGLAWFLFAMSHVPLAQARQALGMDWRRFYDFAAVRAVLRAKRLAALWLALRYLIAGAVFTAVKAAPLALGNILAAQNVSGKVWSRASVGYDLLAAFALLLLLLWLRSAVAGTYARGVVAASVAGRISLHQMPEQEKAVILELDLKPVSPKTGHGRATRAIGATERWLSGVLAGTAALVLWALFVALIYVGQFLNHDWLGWLNHPLVLLPWLSSA